MARGYQVREMRQRILDLLSVSDTGMSGVEISEKLGVSRITTAKYLSMFASQGLVHYKRFGNVTLWTVRAGAETFRFPDDYHIVRDKFMERLIGEPRLNAQSLLQNCLASGASISQLVLDVVLPAVSSIREMYEAAKIGNSELGMLEGVVLNSAKVLQMQAPDPEDGKNAILIAADGPSLLLCQCAEAAYRSGGWYVHNLGDMSSSVDILFDIDLPRFLSRVWRRRTGVMIIAIFSHTEEGLNFFADAVNSAGIKRRRGLFLVLCGRVGKKTKIKSDLTTRDLGKILQWSDTVFESNVE